MVKNRIKVMRAEADISATALAEKLPDVQSKVAMSFIEQGRVLPTRDSLEQMCELLGCTPTDLYRERDLDLLSVGGGEADSEFEVEGFQKPETTRPTDKEGQERIRVWMLREEKEALLQAIAGLGYKNVTEWLREMYRATMQRYIELQLDKHKRIYQAITPSKKAQAQQAL
ncbi:MAG: helix-turn-helix transcriptional regulator [Christensenellales bacterium]|jgi:DNA-binding XRE family transcriptional regulator